MARFAMIRDQICHNLNGGIDWNGESYSLRSNSNSDVDTDYLAVDVEKRSTGVSRIDVCVGLNEVVVLLRSINGDIAMKCADDADSYGVLISEWIADSDNRFASQKAFTTTYTNYLQVTIRRYFD